MPPERGGWAFEANYAASKGSGDLLMRSLAQEFAPRKFALTQGLPGAIRTPINRSAWGTEKAMKNLLDLIPYRCIGEPDDTAHAVLWLASDL
jgi:glucose 1-dehydrogenase